MTSRGKVRAGLVVDAALERAGHVGPDLLLARGTVRDWVRARRATRGRRGSVVGLGVTVHRAGRTALVPIEAPLAGPGEVTVEMLVSAISPGTERAQWLRLPHAQPELPHRPGYSGAGRVLAVGPDVTSLRVGDVVAVPRAPHASVTTVPASWAVRVADGVPLEQAALIYLAIISGFGLRQAGVVAGRAVVVLGSGPIGALAARLAVQAGAGPVTIVARSRRREGTAAVPGVTLRVAGNGLAELAAPVVVDATGDPASIGDAVTACADGGTVVLLGSPRGVSRAVPVAEVQRRRLRMVGAHISALATVAKRTGEDPFDELARVFLDGVAAGTLPVADLAGEAIDPRETRLMYDRFVDGSLAAAHLDWRVLPAADRVRRRTPLHPPVLPVLRGTVPAAERGPVSVTARPLRFAVVGCGDIGLSNARAVSRAGNAELVLVHDPVQVLAAAVAKSHGGAVVTALEEALDPARVDAVVLSVPHDLHEPLVLRATGAGLHVVVEKPLAVDLPSARRCVEAAARAGVVLTTCFPYRYEAAPSAARALADAGALGELTGAAVVFHADKPAAYWHGGFSGRAASNWRNSRSRAGGGVLIMNLTHHLDLLRHISGREIIQVSAVARSSPGQEVEDGIAATVVFEGGAVGTLLGSASTRGAPASRAELWGTLGTLQLEPEPRAYSDLALPGMLPGRWTDLPTDPVDERRTFVERFAAAVREGREPDVTAADGLAVQAVVEAVYRSVSSGRPEAVER